MNTANKVYLDDDGIIAIEVIGDQDVESVENMGALIAALIKERRREGKPVLILDNLLLMGNVGAAARQKVVDLSKTLDYDRGVMLGRGNLMGFGFRVMLRATRRTDKIRYFGNKEQALAWLLSTKKR